MKALWRGRPQFLQAVIELNYGFRVVGRGFIERRSVAPRRAPDQSWTGSCTASAGLNRRCFLKVLFVTPEIDDFVRVGGLAAVSAALPRALRAWSDVRILLPGYREVAAQ